MQALLGVLLLIASVNCLDDSKSNIVELTESNFNELVIDSDDFWLVEFYSPSCSKCKSFKSTYKTVATALRGVVKVGSVDVEKHDSFKTKYGKNLPAVKIFGANKQKPQDYKGDKKAGDIVDAVLNAINDKINAALGRKKREPSCESKSKDTNAVIELTDSNFKKLVLESTDIWLVEFFAPWCGHCKNLAPAWAAAARELQGKVKLGALDATVHQTTARKYNINGYPTIKYFAAGVKDKNSAADYDGGRSQQDIVNWALSKVVENVPAPEIVQLTSEQVLLDACAEKPLCVVAVFPHILDCQSKCRNDYLKILKTLGEKYKQKMWGWVWSEGGSQPEAEKALEIDGFGYPAMAVVNAKKMKYVPFRGAFSESGIDEFLRDLSYGKGRPAPIRGAELPKIEDVEPWDGKDGVYPQEDEFDVKEEL